MCEAALEEHSCNWLGLRRKNENDTVEVFGTNVNTQMDILFFAYLASRSFKVNYIVLLYIQI